MSKAQQVTLLALVVGLLICSVNIARLYHRVWELENLATQQTDHLTLLSKYIKEVDLRDRK